MEKELNDILEKRIKVLGYRIKELRKQKNKLSFLKFSEKEFFKFSISNILPNPPTGKVGITELDHYFEKIKNNAFVYVYEIDTMEGGFTLDKVKLLKSFNELRLKKETGKTVGKYSKIRSGTYSKFLEKECLGRELSEDDKLTKAKLEKNFSNILYVGCVEKNIHIRTKAHLGWGSDTTYALRLKDWNMGGEEKKYVFKFYCIKVEDITILRDIEAAISKELEPLLGKDEKF